MYVLEPTSIAVIGASAEEKKLGHYILSNLVNQGYKGTIYPVNPKQDVLLGLKTYHSIEEIPGAVDMAVVVTPAVTVCDVAESCGKKGVKTLVVISAGFGEMGTPDGHEREEKLKEIVKKYGISLVGPNCLGVLRPDIRMNASFALDCGKPGSIALISQSGAMAVALLDKSPELSIGYSLVASIGNKAGLDESDFLEICHKDPKTKVIGCYLESIKDGRRFLEVASNVAKDKPIVLIKSGVSVRGSMAVSSHTGALAGSDTAIDAACMQAGIRRARTTNEFLGLLQTLATQPPLLSSQVAVITNAGGPGVLATDAAEREGLMLTSLTEEAQTALKAKLPAAASVKNPIDVLGDALGDRYEAAIAACAADRGIDGVAVMLTPQVMTPCAEVAKAIVRVSHAYPLMPVVASFMGHDSVLEARKILGDGGVPHFETPEEAMHGLAALRACGNPGYPACQPGGPGGVQPKAWKILEGVDGLLDEKRSAELFALYKLPMPNQEVSVTADQAVKIAETIGYPVIAKISSPEILHKTDVGGVRANLNSADEVRKAFVDIMANCKKNMPSANLNGVLVQQFLPAGNEFIVGALRDPGFGPLVMVGLGGIYTELFRDTAFRVAPIDEEQAYAMLVGLKSWKLLLGMRGKPQSDIAALAAAIAGVSRMVTDCPQIAELDLNPVLVRPEGLMVADAKVVIHKP